MTAAHRSPPRPSASRGVVSFIHEFERSVRYAIIVNTVMSAQPAKAASMPASTPRAHPCGTATRIVARSGTYVVVVRRGLGTSLMRSLTGP